MTLRGVLLRKWGGYFLELQLPVSTGSCASCRSVYQMWDHGLKIRLDITMGLSIFLLGTGALIYQITVKLEGRWWWCHHQRDVNVSYQ